MGEIHTEGEYLWGYDALGWAAFMTAFFDTAREQMLNNGMGVLKRPEFLRTVTFQAMVTARGLYHLASAHLPFQLTMQAARPQPQRPSGIPIFKG